MKAYAIATNTFKEGVRQPVFYVLVAGGCVLMLLSVYFTLFSFGEEAKLVKDMGLATITLFGLIVALFTSSGVISDEIEKKTVLTVLCKPVTRTEFVLGKFFGIVAAAFAAMAVLALALLLALYLHDKTGDIHVHRAVARAAPSHVAPVAIGTLFGFFQVFVLSAVSVAVSTRFPMMVNLSVCLSLYVLGHVSRYIFVSTVRGSAAGYVATLLYAVVPNLSNFNVAGALGMGQTVPISYIGLSALSAVLYAGVALLVALASFQTREVM